MEDEIEELRQSGSQTYPKKSQKCEGRQLRNGGQMPLFNHSNSQNILLYSIQKIIINGVGIFTNQTKEIRMPCSDLLDFIFVNKREYELVDFEDEDRVYYLDELGEWKEGLEMSAKCKKRLQKSKVN